MPTEIRRGRHGGEIAERQTRLKGDYGDLRYPEMNSGEAKGNALE